MQKKPKPQTERASVTRYQIPGRDSWVVLATIQCAKCGGMIFMQAINPHGDAGIAYAVCPACIQDGWKIDPVYATEHPEVAEMFDGFRASLAQERPPRSTFHEYPCIDASLVQTLARPVDELDLPMRLKNAIRNHRAGVLAHVIDLAQMTEADILKIHGVGVKSLHKIKKILAKTGLSLNIRLDIATINATRAFIAQHKSPG